MAPFDACRYRPGPFEYGLEPSTVEYLGWRFTHDAQGSFTGLDFRADLASQRDFAERYEWMSTAPDSPFVRAWPR